MKKLWLSGCAVVWLVVAVGCVSGDDGDGAGDGADGSAGNGSTDTDEPGGTGAQDASGDGDGIGDTSDTSDGDGDGDGDEACPAITGTFEATYTEVSGSCGTVEGHERFPLDGGRSGVNINIDRRVSANVSTEVVLKGCTLDVSQIVSDGDGAVISQVIGEGLAIESETRVTGYVTFTRYDEAGTQSCEGGYDIVLSQSSTLIGGAAGDFAGDQSGTTGGLWSAAHTDEIENDCNETVQCRAQRGEPLPDDPIASCVTATSQLLDADAARQEAFLASVERCESFVVCQYVDCVLASM